jgi:hypothetical protein
MPDAPWGFIATSHGFTATTTVAQRRARAALGEFAISFLGRLGVSEEVLEKLAIEPDPVEALKKIQTPVAPPAAPAVPPAAPTAAPAAPTAAPNEEPQCTTP